MSLDDKTELDLCSAKGCQAVAAWELRWSNPKIHNPDRRKIWLACEAHKQSLSDFLGSRGFLKEVEPH
ncbi:acetone carboxylase [Nocardioides sp.]|uniref:acetone carboxylase n=1 Tax=Nocardioides sp. TaxID=35761 RepID=UPI0039E27768